MVDSLSKKQLPSNLDVERQVLGNILIDPNAIDIAAVRLVPEDFYSPKHQEIYRTCLSIYHDREAIDFTSTTARIPALKTTIAELIDGVRKPYNTDTYVKIVKQLSEKRGILGIAQRLVDMAYDKELTEVKSFAKDVVTKVLTNDDERRSLLSPADQVALLQKIIDEKREGISNSISSGFPKLDGLTGGLRRGDLIVVGARTSVGKSSFVECIAENVAEQGYPVLFVSVEMDPAQMAFRFAKRWGLSPAVLEYGSDDSASQSNLQKVVERRLDTPLYIWNAPGANTVGIRAHLNQMLSDVGAVDLIVVDYLQLLTDTFGGRAPEHLRLGLITKTLKQIAREYEIPIVLVTQLNRSSDQRGVLPEPRLSDIRESGRIEEDADLILFLWKEKKVDILGNDTKMKIAKNRQGPLGEVPIRFNKPYFTFKEPTDSEVQLMMIHRREEEEDREYHPPSGSIESLMGGNPAGINYLFDDPDTALDKQRRYDAARNQSSERSDPEADEEDYEQETIWDETRGEKAEGGGQEAGA